MDAVHFLPYGEHVSTCGRIADQRFPARWTDRRRETTCCECQVLMTDLGDLPQRACPYPWSVEDCAQLPCTPAPSDPASEEGDADSVPEFGCLCNSETECDFHRSKRSKR